MDEWLAEFSNWVFEEEEFEAFAQTLCYQFCHWTTEEEEYLQYSTEFLKSKFPLLPSVLRSKI